MPRPIAELRASAAVVAPMPRYFFHTENGAPHVDREGVEFPTLDAAREEAVETLGELLKGRTRRLWADESFKLTVTDDKGLVLFVLEVTVTEAPAVTG